MFVIGFLLVVVGILSGALSIVFVTLAAHAGDTHQFARETTWAGFFQGLFFGTTVSGLAMIALHLLRWR